MRLDEVQAGMRVAVMDKPPENKHEGPGWVSDMDQYLGTMMTVHGKGSCYVLLLEDGFNHLWNPKWLSPVDLDCEADDVADDASIECLFS